MSRLGWQREWNLWAVAGLGLVGAGLVALSARVVEGELLRPLDLRPSDYVGSRSCRSCHADHYRSWHATFHRTMTQRASPASVGGDFSGRTLVYGGIRARMERDTEGFRIDFERIGSEQRWQARIERTVGSRRYQQYLARDGDVYFRLPIAWNFEQQRFVHMNGAFLTPDPTPVAPGHISRSDYDRHVTRWNDNCIFCHNVAPNPGLDPQAKRFESTVGELGIACEACHGPGSAHVARNRNPLRRYTLHLRGLADPTIANPQRLQPTRSAMVCGRCHGQRITRDIDAYYQHGDPFLPGEDLVLHSRPLQRDTTLNGEAGVFSARFWSDGTPRLTAYEYQGLLASPCAQRGQLRCASCHAMHAGDPRGQLRPEHEGEQACLACHSEYRNAAARGAHTQHRSDSSGSDCLACHMPPIVYGLVTVHRSHRIEVPNPAAQAAHQRPDACTLCHVGRSRRWAAEQVQRLWGLGGPALPPPMGALPEVPGRALAGDPIERAVAATALGRAPPLAQELPTDRRLGLLLDGMLHDAYPGVRSVQASAVRSLLSQEHPQALPALRTYRPTDWPSERAASVERVRAALPPDAVQPPDPQLARSLRAQASEVAIAIGE